MAPIGPHLAGIFSCVVAKTDRIEVALSEKRGPNGTILMFFTVKEILLTPFRSGCYDRVIISLRAMEVTRL